MDLGGFLFGYDIGTQRGAINIWDVATKTKRCSLARAGKGEFVLSVAFSNLPAAGGEGVRLHLTMGP